MFEDKLREELNKTAPEWEWSCTSDNSKSPDLISPKLMSVSARNKQSGARTSSIQVSTSPTSDVQQAARFIRDLLMITPPEPALAGPSAFRRLT